MITHRIRHILLLLLIYFLLLIVGYIIITDTSYSLEFEKFAVLLTSMTLITLGAYAFVLLGQRKNEKAQGIFLLAGLGGKFLAYLVLIFIFWIQGKNLTKEFIIAFFVLYLLLTLFLAGVLFKTMKTN